MGINPLYSMMLHHAHLLATGFWGTGPLPQAHLLFTASCSEELLFKVILYGAHPQFMPVHFGPSYSGQRLPDCSDPQREVEELSSLHPSMSHTFFVTKEGTSSRLPTGIQCGRPCVCTPVQCVCQCSLSAFLAGRISHQHYQEALLRLASGRSHCSSSTTGGQVSSFICGPPPLIEAATDSLTSLGVLKTDIHFEQWW